MRRRRLVVTLLVVGVLLLAAGATLGVATLAGASWLPWSRRVSQWMERPDLNVVPPDSLEDLAAEYPELAQLLGDPELGSVYKEFLVAYQEGGVEAASELAQARGLLTPDGEHLRVTLVLDIDDPAPLAAQLEGVGVEVVTAYKDRINIAVPVALIEQAFESEETGEVFRRLTELEHVIAVRLPDQAGSNQQDKLGEGVGIIGADAWHDAGYRGEGIRVGVLDLGFAGHEDLLGDELPERVAIETFGWFDDEEVHGTACAEIVHEVAPGAELVFAWYDGSDAAMGEAVDWLLEHDVDIITHSAGGVLDPRDGTGWSARLVDEIVAKGIVWVNSSGNEADVHFRDQFSDANGDSFHDFGANSAVLPIYVHGYVRVYLTWREDWDRPVQDLELVLLNEKGDVIAASEDAQDGQPGQQPAEWIVLETDEDVVYAAVYAYDVDRAVTFDIFALGPGVEIVGATASYSVGSPGDAAGSLTVGAVDWSSDRLAGYSSQGPTTDERLKPEISGPTGVSGATYGRVGFDGTSASAPHVAGAAALVLQAHPGFTRQEVVDYLLAAAVDLGPAGPDTGYGIGRLALPAPPAAAVPLPTPTASVAPEQATSVPATLAPATPVAFVTPAPAAGGGGSGPVILFGLVVGGLGLGGGGLLLIGGALLLSDMRRPKPRPAPVRRAPVEPMGGFAQPEPPVVQHAPSHDDLPSTQVWLGTAHPKDDRAEALPHSYEPVASTALCPVCGAKLRPGARFCAVCGSPVSSPAHQDLSAEGEFCKHCGAPLRPGSRFCAKCGKPA